MKNSLVCIAGRPREFPHSKRNLARWRSTGAAESSAVPAGLWRVSISAPQLKLRAIFKSSFGTTSPSEIGEEICRFSDTLLFSTLFGTLAARQRRPTWAMRMCPEGRWHVQGHHPVLRKLAIVPAINLPKSVKADDCSNGHGWEKSPVQ